MRKGKIKNLQTGEVIDVIASTSHKDSSYNNPVWVDENDVAYMQCSLHEKNPLYNVIYDSYSERARVGRMIADIRNKKGLSVRELGEMADVSYTNIGKIERGVYNVSVDILRKICDALNVEIILKEK